MAPHKANDFRAKFYDVFVSYNHDDDDARAVLVKALEAADYGVFWDAKLNQDDWRGELRDEINRSSMVICLWSEKAAASDNVKAEAFHAFGIKKLLSVHIENRSVVPRYFQNTNLHPFDGWRDEARRRVQVAKILATLERVTGGPSRKRMEADHTAIIPVEWGNITGAPVRLVGREVEIAMLKAAWESRAPKKVNVVLLHALGGAGKSALLRSFANEIIAEGGCGATRIYGWSAYSQGSGEQKRADTDGFVAKALSDLGFQGFQPSDPVERVRALANLIQRQRMLLLLDGVEPLQDPPDINNGRFKDRAFAELLKILASQNLGLLVLTTRQQVPELEGYGTLAISHPLDQMSSSAGAELLVDLGVRGRQHELEEAIRSVDGHALSVTLIGAYISEVCGGDIRHLDSFDLANTVLTQAEEEDLATDKTVKPAKRVAKVMQGYLELFDRIATDGAAAGIGKAAQVLLCLVGLFDRPADGPAIEALLNERIPGLTADLFFDTVSTRSGWWLFRSPKVEMRELTLTERNQRIRHAKEVLRKLRLLSRPNPADPQELDAHPIVRAFFAGRLEVIAPEAARAAHEVLYRHYSKIAPDQPESLDAMQPVFYAIQHGVKGGQVQDARDEMLWQRILRRNENYIMSVLGAYGQFLTSLSHFFDPPWRQVHAEVSPATRAWLMGMAAYALKSTGRLKDAVEPRRASIDLHLELGDWDNAASLTNSLCQELLILGDVAGAIAAGSRAIEYSKHGSDVNVRWFCISDYADAQAQSGAYCTAYDLMQGITNHYNGTLIGFSGYKYGDLLLSLHDPASTLVIAENSLASAKHHVQLAFIHLLIGRAQDILGKPEAGLTLETAVAEFRKAGVTHHLPKGLLARAMHRRRRAAGGELDLVRRIREDLLEIEDIAGAEMNLYLTDLALERARLAIDVPSAFADLAGARAEAEAQTARAAELIAATGYNRRDPELADLRSRLGLAG